MPEPEPLPEHITEGRRWFRYATEDLVAAETMLGEEGFAPRHACWLAQQAAEKAIKCGLVFLQIDFPRTHDLDVLRMLLPDDWRLMQEQIELASLTEWAVAARYPDDVPDASILDARAATAKAREVFEFIRTDLLKLGFLEN